MKWLAASVCLIFMAGFTGAHTGDHSNLPEPGTTPGSTLFGLEQAQESVSLALTFNPQKKAHKRLHIAQERLSEAEKLSNSNKSENAEKAVQMHSKAMERADKAVQRLPEEKRGNTGQELNNTRNQSVSVLQDLKQKLPESAMNGIETAIQAHQQKGIGRAGKNTEPGKPQNGTQQPRDRIPRPPSQQPDPQTSSTKGGYIATGRVIRNS